MTTAILPTKTQLVAQTFAPSQLVLDVEVENFLITNKFNFVLALMAALRGGVAQSYTYYITVTSPTAHAVSTVFNSTPTSFVYKDKVAIVAALVNYLTNAAYGYGYTVSAWSNGSWAPITSGNGTLEVDADNTATGNSFILVAWA
jgi:hypothetical protein